MGPEASAFRFLTIAILILVYPQVVSIEGLYKQTGDSASRNRASRILAEAGLLSSRLVSSQNTCPWLLRGNSTGPKRVNWLGILPVCSRTLPHAPFPDNFCVADYSSTQPGTESFLVWRRR